MSSAPDVGYPHWMQRLMADQSSVLSASMSCCMVSSPSPSAISSRMWIRSPTTRASRTVTTVGTKAIACWRMLSMAEFSAALSWVSSAALATGIDVVIWTTYAVAGVAHAARPRAISVVSMIFRRCGSPPGPAPRPRVFVGPDLLLCELALPRQPLILRVLLGSADVDALAVPGIGIGVLDAVARGAACQPVRRHGGQLLLPLGGVGELHPEPGRRQELLPVERLRVADRRAAREPHGRRQRE